MKASIKIRVTFFCERAIYLGYHNYEWQFCGTLGSDLTPKKLLRRAKAKIRRWRDQGVIPGELLQGYDPASLTILLQRVYVDGTGEDCAQHDDVCPPEILLPKKKMVCDQVGCINHKDWPGHGW